MPSPSRWSSPTPTLWIGAPSPSCTALARAETPCGERRTFDAKPSEEASMRVVALSVATLLMLPAVGGEMVPSSDVVGGLRRAARLGAALEPAEGGVAIPAVGPGTSAEKMGLQPGD